MMPDQVPDQIKTVRSAELLELSRQKQKAYEETLIGTTLEVLMEEETCVDGKVYQTGHTKEYVKAVIPYCKDMKNIMAEGVLSRMLTGEIMELECCGPNC